MRKFPRTGRRRVGDRLMVSPGTARLGAEPSGLHSRKAVRLNQWNARMEAAVLGILETKTFAECALKLEASDSRTLQKPILIPSRKSPMALKEGSARGVGFNFQRYPIDLVAHPCRQRRRAGNPKDCHTTAQPPAFSFQVSRTPHCQKTLSKPHAKWFETSPEYH